MGGKGGRLKRSLTCLVYLPCPVMPGNHEDEINCNSLYSLFVPELRVLLWNDLHPMNPTHLMYGWVEFYMLYNLKMKIYLS